MCNFKLRVKANNRVCVRVCVLLFEGPRTKNPMVKIYKLFLKKIIKMSLDPIKILKHSKYTQNKIQMHNFSSNQIDKNISQNIL